MKYLVRCVNVVTITEETFVEAEANTEEEAIDIVDGLIETDQDSDWEWSEVDSDLVDRYAEKVFNAV